jgi:hypothetical protein
MKWHFLKTLAFIIGVSCGEKDLYGLGQQKQHELGSKQKDGTPDVGEAGRCCPGVPREGGVCALERTILAQRIFSYTESLLKL